MNRSPSKTLIVALAIAALSSGQATVSAQEITPTPLSTDEVRTQFERSGFTVDRPIQWVSSGLTTFYVQDPSERGRFDRRIIMVLVYPDIAHAQADRQLAEASQESRALGANTDPAVGPVMIPGYGPSVWRDNVAIVQSTSVELGRMYSADYGVENAVAFGTYTSGALRTSETLTRAPDVDILTAFDAMPTLNM